MVRLLLDTRADVNVRATDGWTALYGAIQRHATDVVCALLAAGADPNTTDRLGESVLRCAIRQDSVVLVECLIRAGARTDTADIQFAWDQDAPAAARYLSWHKRQGMLILRKALRQEEPELD